MTKPTGKISKVDAGKNTSRVMNSTLGHYFKQTQQLPPLSSLSKYEKQSTRDGNRDHSLVVTGHRRAATKMEERTPATDFHDMRAPKDKFNQRKLSKQLPHDPFYSPEMITLADEAKK